MTQRTSFGWAGFGIRLLFAILLVFATYNPEGWSYWHWALTPIAEFNAIKALAGIVLIIGWTVYVRASLRSLGTVGLTLAAVLFGVLVWVVIDLGLVAADTPRAISYIVMVVLSGILAVGMSWSHVRRRLSGQVDADDVDA